jgi:long-chain acyl-CoA synthetase
MWLGSTHGGRTALVARDGACSYSELAARTLARARLLRTLDDGLAIVTASMTVEFVATLLAFLGLPRPVAIFSSGWTEDERASRRALLGRCLEVDERGAVVGRWDGPSAAVHPEARLVLFTAGSTGRPKAVQLSETNIRANTRAVIEALDFGSAEAQTLFLPLSYSFGLLGHLLPALELGVPTELVERLVDAARLFASGTIPGMVGGVPSHFEVILRALPAGHACDRISHVVTAGAYSSPDLRWRLRGAFPSATIYNNYGQTEAAPRILCLPSSHPEFFTPATGYPVGDLRVRLSGEGELMVSGSQIMLGYLGDAEGTREKVRDGWLATGDLARIDPGGLVTITGRMDEIVNVGGERISVLEIESAIRRIEGVRNAGVLAVPDALYGASLVAYVEMAEGSTEADVLSPLRGLVSQSKMPKELHIVPALPLTAHGKADKPALAALHRQRAAL